MKFSFADSELKPSSSRLDGLEEKIAANGKRRLPFHVGFLDDITRGILPTDLVVILSGTGAGKTSFLANLAHNSASAGCRVGFFALEAYKGEVEARLLFKEMAKLAHHRRIQGAGRLTYADWLSNRCEDIVSQVVDDAKTSLQRTTGSMRTLYRNSSFTVDNFVDVFRAAESDLDLVILDHLHFVDINEEDENKGLKRVIKTISDLVRDFEVPVVLAAQTRKKDTRSRRLLPTKEDLHGSSEVMRATTRLISFGRYWQAERKVRGLYPTLVRVEKDRVCGETEYTAQLGFDSRTAQYRKGYELGRLSFDGSQWEKADSQHPIWAKNALLGGI